MILILLLLLFLFGHQVKDWYLPLSVRKVSYRYMVGLNGLSSLRTVNAGHEQQSREVLVERDTTEWFAIAFRGGGE